MPLVKTDADAPEREKPRRMDRTLQLCARLDRMFEELEPWGREVVALYLRSKWIPKQDAK